MNILTHSNIKKNWEKRNIQKNEFPFSHPAYSKISENIRSVTFEFLEFYSTFFPSVQAVKKCFSLFIPLEVLQILY
jgi:hypothetical protein